MEIDQGDIAGVVEVGALLRNAERRERELRQRFRLLLKAIEDKAAQYGTAAQNPLEHGRGNHTRTNRVKLSFLSCGLNEAAEFVRLYAPHERSGSQPKRLRGAPKEPARLRGGAR